LNEITSAAPRTTILIHSTCGVVIGMVEGEEDRHQFMASEPGRED
jgi:hypothetical protein